MLPAVPDTLAGRGAVGEVQRDGGRLDRHRGVVGVGGGPGHVTGVRGDQLPAVGVQVEVLRGPGQVHDPTQLGVKGGAGQAIQSFNIMMGYDETLTLMEPGLWP